MFTIAMAIETKLIEILWLVFFFWHYSVTDMHAKLVLFSVLDYEVVESSSEYPQQINS